MADNYLEKRMEEYRAGRLAPKTRVVVRDTRQMKREPGEYSLVFPPMRVAIIGGDVGMVGALARKFRSVGCQVAICHGDSKNCTRIAQTEGCRYYPFDPQVAENRLRMIDDLTVRWGGTDVVMDLRGMDDWTEEMAGLLLLHSHPDFGFVQSVEVGFEE